MRTFGTHAGRPRIRSGRSTYAGYSKGCRATLILPPLVVSLHLLYAHIDIICILSSESDITKVFPKGVLIKFLQIYKKEPLPKGRTLFFYGEKYFGGLRKDRANGVPNFYKNHS